MATACRLGAADVDPDPHALHPSPVEHGEELPRRAAATRRRWRRRRNARSSDGQPMSTTSTGPASARQRRPHSARPTRAGGCPCRPRSRERLRRSRRRHPRRQGDRRAPRRALRGGCAPARRTVPTVPPRRRCWPPCRRARPRPARTPPRARRRAAAETSNALIAWSRSKLGPIGDRMRVASAAAASTAERGDAPGGLREPSGRERARSSTARQHGGPRSRAAAHPCSPCRCRAGRSPASSARTAAAGMPMAPLAPAMSSASLTMTPSKPSSSRSRSVEDARARTSPGPSASTCREQDVRRHDRARAGLDRGRGTARSSRVAQRRRASASTTGRPRCESVARVAVPREVLGAHGDAGALRARAPRPPCAERRASRSAPKLRMPMTGLSGFEFMSASGAKLRLHARRRAARPPTVRTHALGQREVVDAARARRCRGTASRVVVEPRDVAALLVDRDDARAGWPARIGDPSARAPARASAMFVPNRHTPASPARRRSASQSRQLGADEPGQERLTRRASADADRGVASSLHRPATSPLVMRP